jgi:hypothetical protein
MMSALVHHERWGGMQSRQVEKIAEHAGGILKLQGIHQSSSRLGSLFADLHLVLSQIHRKSGEHWRAAWQQQMAERLQKKSDHQAHGAAIRALRLGHAQLAIPLFQKAAASDNPLTRHRALLGLIKCLRLAGEHIEAKRQIDALSSDQLSEAGSTELAWEVACLNAGAVELARSVKRGKPHFQGIYVLEAYLWARATEDRTTIDWLSSLNTYRRNKTLRIPYLGALDRIAQAIDHCYDNSFEFHLRLERLGETLNQVPLLLSVEQELLTWAAAARWLARHNAASQAALCLAQYAGLSLRLTGGASKDAMGLCGDMLQREWFAA